MKNKKTEKEIQREIDLAMAKITAEHTPRITAEKIKAMFNRGKKT
jgi:hypothetical protein